MRSVSSALWTFVAPMSFSFAVHADAHGRWATVRETGVDAMAGAHERLVGHEVRRREAELPATLIAMGDLTAQLEGGTQQLIGLRHLPGEQQTADVTGGDDLAA